MPFLKRQGNKKINPQYVEDPSARNNFEVITDNISEIFRRLDKQRWALGDSSGSYSLSPADNAIHRPDNLRVKLDCTGKNPVFLTLVQQSEVVQASATSIGGIEILNHNHYAISRALFYLFIGNVTQQRVVHGELLGFHSEDVDNTASAVLPPYLSEPFQRDILYPPGALSSVDLSPSVGINEWEVMIAMFGTEATINIQDCQLFAVELF